MTIAYRAAESITDAQNQASGEVRSKQEAVIS